MTHLSGRERLLKTIAHEEPDRVPICPRMHTLLEARHGSQELETILDHYPHVDPMYIVYDWTLNTLDEFPDHYDLPDVQVEQKKSLKDSCTLVERTFHTPEGTLSDKTVIPPPRGEYGMTPNPQKIDYLVKTPDDLAALPYVLAPISRDFEFLNRLQQQIRDRGVVMVAVRASLDHHAGLARDMAQLMMDYYDNRPFFDAVLDIFHRRALDLIRAACEGGATFIFGSWYYHSISAGWSPSIFREVFLPQIRDHVRLTHSYGAYYDYYDDGKLAKTLPMIAKAGVDIVETCAPPPTGDVDLREAKASVGSRITLKGAIDLLDVMRFGTPAVVDRAVRDAMEAAKDGGGFIIGSSDSFREDTPEENLKAYFDACLKYGRY
jgi:uroporphyrinogen decarboxylase